MSGFQIKTWWACSTEPQTAHSAIQTGRYGRGSLAIIPSKQDSIASDAIVVGGLDGHLRIYRPSDSTLTPKHLRLQTHLQAPIIQIAVGKFSSQDGVSVALLFPASLAIFKFIDAESSSLQRLYDLKLPAPSANFVHGKFKGLSNGQEQCCVQTQNGSMVIVDDGRIAAEASFGNFLVPGPMCFHHTSNCIILSNSALYVESYRVEQILSSAESSKAMQPVWRALIGENITHVDCITTQFEVEIVVIGQQHIFTLTESGELKRQMIIEVETACCGKAFTSKGDTFITCSTTGIFKLFQNFQLEWAAQAEFVPVSIVIGEFCGIPGFIVSIDASGYLIAAYLGTEIRPFKRLSERRSTERLDLSRSGSQTQLLKSSNVNSLGRAHRSISV
ncbi:PTHB1, N-terminal domain-containing protein [Zopfochytrium polystomum]|nr:PTHB1, N-terminal domain-containing protein [Zopfochytrium polystomum]